MKRIGAFRADRSMTPDFGKGLPAVAFLLAGIGSVALFSASWYFSREVSGDPLWIWRRQLVWTGLGALAGIALSRVPVRTLKAAVPALVVAAVVLNLLTYVPGIGSSAGGARRWIEVFGYSFQPSEVTRLAMVLYLARMLEKNKDRMENLRDGFLPPFLLVLFLAALVYFQNDFSTTIYLLAVALGMFFAAGTSWKGMGAVAAATAAAGGLMLAARPYRVERLRIWFHPELDPAGAGYQLLKARGALARGGLWGQGLGRSATKLGGLPSAHSDFVAAVMGEEAGLFGIVVILGLFTLLAAMGWAAADRAEDEFCRWGAFGITAAVYWQALINFAVVCGALPATGIPLPFFSAAGSSAFVTLAMLGLLVNFAGSGSGGRR